MTLSIHSQIEANQTKSILVVGFFVLFVTMVTFIFAKALGFSPSIGLIALIVASMTALGSYFWGDKIVLSLSHAHLASRQKDFDFYTVSENMAIAAGIPTPKLYVIEDTAVNAFATGRDPKHSVICATRGLLTRLTRRELEGVIAHEMSHVKNLDIRLMVLVAVLAGMVVFLADWFLRALWWGGGRRSRDEDRGASALYLVIGLALAILTPLIATLIQLAVSRRREFLADASSALLTRNPDALADALLKIGKDKEVLEVATNATAHLYFANPFKGKQYTAWFANLFNTHPSIEERVKILRAM